MIKIIRFQTINQGLLCSDMALLLIDDKNYTNYNIYTLQ